MSATKKTFRCKTEVPPPGEVLHVELPFDVKEAFGKARPPITITLPGGYSFRSTVSVYGGKSFIGIRRSHREAAGLVEGQSIAIAIAADDAPRVVEAPADLRAALAKKPAAEAAWNALSFTHQREHVDALEEAKRPETRARRLEKTLEMLLEKKKRRVRRTRHELPKVAQKKKKKKKK